MHKLNNLYLYLSTVKGMNATEIDTILVNFTALHKLMLSIQDDYSYFRNNYSPEDWKAVFDFVNNVKYDTPEYNNFYRDLMTKNRTSMLDGRYTLNQILFESLITYNRESGLFELSIPNDEDLPAVPCFKFRVQQRKNQYLIADNYLLVETKDLATTPSVEDLRLLMNRIQQPENSFPFNAFVIDTGLYPIITKNEWIKLLTAFIETFGGDYTEIIMNENWTLPAELNTDLLPIWNKFIRLYYTNTSVFRQQIQSFGCSFYQDKTSLLGVYVLNYKHQNITNEN